ncbi:MAG: hypothetical protein IPN58_21385 [Anaerolineales bacterium]|nr:hypothetical protein [Anaerolineales bacterium]
MALIVSPRDHIEQTANISVNTDLTIDEQAALENRVDKGLNTSSLVVGIGGVGVYPTMVMRTTDLRWTLNTVAHEWIHNYLTLRPLGILYSETPELRTMNETTASIAGDEIGALVLKQFYPELTTASDSTLSLISAPFDHPEPGDFLRPPFDFREAMHETRITADAFLAEGKIEEAEAYMEPRRLSSSKMDIYCARSTRLILHSTEPTPIHPAVPQGKTPSARQCAPCVSKVIHWLILSTPSRG